MAFLGLGKKEKKGMKAPAKAEKASEKKDVKAPLAVVPETASSVLIRPRITEKTGNLTAANVYTFDVRMDATKKTIATAIHAAYKVTPVKVRIVTRVASRVRLRTRRGYGKTVRGKKAYVFLKKGDRIEFAS